MDSGPGGGKCDMEDEFKTYLAPTSIIDSDHPAVRAHAADAIRGSEDSSVAKAVRLDGHADCLFHPFNEESQLFMEYVRDHGAFADVPVQRLVAAWEEAYSKDRVGRWVRGFEASGSRSIKHFEREDVVDI
jgi:hypothetical protein